LLLSWLLLLLMLFGFVLQRTAAEQVLKTFQENPDAWTRVDTILEKGKTQQTKFFALQVIITVAGSASVKQQHSMLLGRRAAGHLY
jgi:hypothetical protein